MYSLRLPPGVDAIDYELRDPEELGPVKRDNLTYEEAKAAENSEYEIYHSGTENRAYCLRCSDDRFRCRLVDSPRHMFCSKCVQNTGIDVFGNDL